jgi:membrane protease YdiL (CAAX protease family)
MADFVELRPFPMIWKSIAWIVLYFVLQIVTIMAPVVVMVARDQSLLDTLGSNQKTLAILAMWSIILASTLTVLLIWFNVRKQGRSQRIGLFAPPKIPLGETLGLGVALLALSYGLTYLYSTYIIPGVEMQDEIKALLAALPKTPIYFLLQFVAVAIAAPIVEELLFRGYLQTALTARFGAPVAILLASFIFALVHMQPYAIPALMLIGLTFGYLYHRTGSLMVNMGLHVVNNGLALAFS